MSLKEKTLNDNPYLRFMVNGSRFFDEPSDRSTFGRLQGKKVDDMVTNFSMIEKRVDN